MWERMKKDNRKSRKMNKELVWLCKGMIFACLMVGMFWNFNMVTQAAIIDRGSCGENLTYELTDDGTLTISGTGDMYDYALSSNAYAGIYMSPWRYHDYGNGIEVVKIQKGVTSIGASAFSSCDNLQKIVISNSVTSIGECAFWQCPNLQEIEIPDSVTSIGGNAFENCRNLQEIKMSDSVTSIGEYAFVQCESLQEITIPDSVTSIGEGVFAHCQSLQKIKISDNVACIEDSTFSYCESLQEITIPDSVTSIGQSAFGSCDSLREITIPDSVTSIERYAFRYCGSLQEVNISDSVTSIGASAFEDCKNLQKIKMSDGMISIGEYAFCRCENLQEIEIPDSVTSIGASAFEDCKNLQKIKMSDGMISIGEYAFCRCENLQEIEIPDSVTSIGKSAFAACDSLREIEISESMTRIASRTFYGCESLMEVTIPDSVTSIGASAFEDCKNLQKIIIPNSMTDIGESAFEGCENLKKIEIPDSVTKIYADAFRQCNSLTIYCIENSTAHTYAVDNDIPYVLISAFSSENESSMSVKYFSKWDSETQTAYFGDENFLNMGFTTTEETDLSFLSDVSELLNNYVLVETKQRDDGLIASNYLLSIKTIETKAGILNDGSASSITIDGQDYPIRKELFWWRYSNGDKIRYHIYDGVVVDIAELENQIGNLVYWDKEKQELEIIEGDNFKTTVYKLSPFAPEETVNYLGETKWIHKGVQFTIGYIINGEKYIYDVKENKSSSDNEKKQFNEHTYRADVLLLEEFENGNNLTWNKNYVYKYSPTRTFLQSGEIESINDAWRGVTNTLDSVQDLSNLSDYCFEQDDVYTAIILNALEKSVDCNMVDSTAATTISETKRIIGHISDFMKLEHNIELAADTDYSSLSRQEKKSMQDAFKKSLEESSFSSVVNDLKDSAKIMDELLDGSKCLESFVNNTLSYANLCLVSDSMTGVLDEMYAQTPNDLEHFYMRKALSFCSRMIDASKEEFLQEIIKKGVWTSAGKYGINKTISFFWDKVMDNVKIAAPEIAVLTAAYKTARTVSNWVFNTDDISEQIYKMSVLNQYYNVLDDAMVTLVDDYEDDSSVENAKNVLDSLRLLYDFAYEDCELSNKYINSIESATISKILKLLKELGFIEGQDYESAKRYVVSTEANFRYFDDLWSTDWVRHLESDYPQYYWDYAHLIGDDSKPLVVPITKSYNIECPVNVFVYDSEGQLVAYLEDGKAYATGNITVSRNGDQKTIDFYDDATYQIVCEGYDAGEMDIHITEYENQEVIRKAAFYDLTVHNNELYKIDTKENPEDQENYVISTEYNDIIADYDSNLIQESESLRVLKIQGGFFDMEDGPEFETSAYTGERLEICAYVPEGYHFVKWECNAGEEYIGNAFSLTTTFNVPEQNVEIKVIVEKNTTTRISGTDRYETGYKVADALKEELNVENFDSVIIATGKNFADALAGSYLSVVKNAPILLTNGKADNITKLHEYIKENVITGGTIYILGGDAAVPKVVESINGYVTRRLSGNTRYDTNIEILKEAGIEGDTIIVATGKSFADSLSASATKLPILLVRPGNTLNDEQKEILEDMKNIYIVGGEGAVDESYEKELETYGTVERVYGESRYDTSVAIANTFFDNVDTTVVASGKNFPDGLCGGSLAATMNAPLILTADGKATAASEYIQGENIGLGYVLGGDGALSDETVMQVFQLKSSDEIICN